MVEKLRVYLNDEKTIGVLLPPLLVSPRSLGAEKIELTFLVHSGRDCRRILNLLQL